MDNCPSFTDLALIERECFGNGLGPQWLPDWARNIFTGAMSWFFKDASWRHHDFGYSKGHTKEHRYVYDQKFLHAMRKDALSQPCYIWLIAAPIAYCLSWVFYFAVRWFGKSSFHFADRCKTLAEIREKIHPMMLERYG